jgi:hypothetical protein
MLRLDAKGSTCRLAASFLWVPVAAEFTEDLTRDFRSSDEDWMQRRQQERQSWRESLNFHPESLNGSGAARPATFGDKIKEGFDKVGNKGSMLQAFQRMQNDGNNDSPACVHL